MVKKEMKPEENGAKKLTEPARKPTTTATVFPSFQEIDFQIIDYLTKHPEVIEFSIGNEVHEKLGIAYRTFAQHVKKLKDYGILKPIMCVTEEGKHFLELLERIKEESR